MAWACTVNIPAKINVVIPASNLPVSAFCLPDIAHGGQHANHEYSTE
jgi:hypothetical protein